MQITLHSLQDTINFAAKLAPLLSAGDIIALKGDLGAGKTALARSLIQNLAGENIQVASPTFNIVQLYDTDRFTIWHFDLYRLKSEEELVEIGIEDALAYGVSLIEWPDIAKNFLPKETLTINMFCGKNDERVLNLEGIGKWLDIIEKVSDG